MSPSDAHRLQEIYRREFRSLLQYVRGAAPYTSHADRPIRDAVMRIASEEFAGLSAFGDFLEANRITLPNLGSYPMTYTDLNFVAVRHLVPPLLAEQKRDLGKLDTDSAACSEASIRGAIQNLIELHRRHLKEMESLG